MKKLILFILVIITVIATYYLLSTYQKPSSNPQPTEVRIGDKVEYTTGVSVEQNASLAAREAIDLIDRGRVSGDGFSFVPPGNGRIVVELKSPYEENKLKALDWLKSNGYPNINPSTLIYLEL